MRVLGYAELLRKQVRKLDCQALEALATTILQMLQLEKFADLPV